MDSRKRILIDSIRNEFDVRELVCPHTYERWGERSWQFLQADLLEVIRVLRHGILNVPMIVNTWASGGGYDERGLRCNLCDTVKLKSDRGTLYLSPHCMGAAIDFNTKEYDAEHVRNLIRKNWNKYSSTPIRLERNISWVHIDVFDGASNNLITEFNG